jgi:hypothetical protein
MTATLEDRLAHILDAITEDHSDRERVATLMKAGFGKDLPQ